MPSKCHIHFLTVVTAGEIRCHALKVCEISGFCHGVVEIFNPLDRYAV